MVRISQRLCSAVVLCGLAWWPSGHAVAQEAAQLSQELPPKESVQLMRAARIARMRGDFAGELAKLQEALERFPGDIRLVFALFEYQRAHGRTAELDQDLRVALARRLNESTQPISSAVLFQLIADLRVDAEILTLLEEHLTERVRRAAANAELVDGKLLEGLAEIQRRLGLDEAAAATLIQLSKQDSSHSQLWALVGLLGHLERWSEQADYLQILVDSGTLDLALPLVQALARAGRLEEAIARVKTLAEGLGPQEDQLATSSFIQAARYIAWIARDQGNDEAAQQLFRLALAVNPDDKGIQATLLHLYGSQEEQASLAAAEADRRAAETDPQTMLDEGTHLLATGDVEAAIALLKRAAPSFPELEAVWYNLGMAGYRLGEWSTAESAFAKAAQLNPGRAQSYYFRGISLVQSKRCREAIDPLLLALQLDASRTQAHYYLSNCYLKAGNLPEYERHKKLYDASKK